jgi:ElaB/YqjD/DUF883 family membrane-anchored ribosome-binding protein
MTRPSTASISTEAATAIKAKLTKVLNQPLDVLRREGRRMVVEAWASFEYDPKLETLKVKEQFCADRRMQLVAAADQAKAQYDALRERLEKEMPACAPKWARVRTPIGNRPQHRSLHARSGHQERREGLPQGSPQLDES